MPLKQELQDKLVNIAQNQINECLEFRKPKILEIEKYMRMYNNKVERELKNRWNLPLPILSGYVDTLMSKIDDVPTIKFEREEEADLKVANKVTEVWKAESGQDRGNWAYVDRAVKKLAIFSGFGVYKYFAESDPHYKSTLEAVDFYDFIFEPKGGANIDNHIFKGQINIFRTDSDIREGIESGVYQLGGGTAILTNIDGKVNKKDMQEVADEKQQRYVMLGLDAQMSEYVGESITALSEMYIKYQGEDYYLFFDAKSGNVLRAEKLIDVFSDNLSPFVAWHTNEDAFNFLSKSSLSDIYPIAEGMKVVFNEAMNNLQKRNWNQRAFDKNVIKNPRQLTWRMDGLVQADLRDGQDIRSAIMDLKVEDNTQSVERLISFLDSFVGQKTGITPSAQGVSEKDKKVGVLHADLAQVADRLGLLNKSYREAWARLGNRFVSGAKEHLKESYAVKLIGLKGVEWDELKGSEINNLNISITGGNAEAEENEIKKAKQTSAIIEITNAQLPVNPTWKLEQMLRTAEFPDEEIKRAMDNDMQGDDMIMSECAMAMQIIVQNPKESLESLLKQNDKGQAKLKVNSGATIGFLEKILDFIEDTDLKPNVANNLFEYQQLHIPIVQRNNARKVNQMNIERQLASPEQLGGGEAVPDRATENMASQVEGTRGAVQSVSQNVTQQLTPSIA